MTARPGVAIVGCGSIGRKRAAALGEARLVACADTLPERAVELAHSFSGATAVPSAADAACHPDADIVIVATTNDALTPVAIAAVNAGKHVLVEKPAARDVAELDRLIDAARRSRRLVRVGFNHRYHPALIEARAIVDSGVLGSLMFVRGRYGHGGRLGYEREWRADPLIAGGGELIDQGVHLIDLAGWLLGELTDVQGLATTYFWPMKVDDNAFLTLRTAAGQTAFLHVSCTEWKNLFSLEIYGREGKIAIDGLGGSYGVERIAHYRMLPEMGPPETVIHEYPGVDRSWQLEFAEFLDDIRQNREPSANLEAARRALAIVGQVYERSRQLARAAVT
ncbi:MAG: Gfo/Idh/MocA family oxidoreductase [Acidobacteria bacterium]|nr:Gfo/Idh/MocA family oxidoreductase [Acidobacteriota bacterium]